MAGYLTSERLRDIEARLAREGRVVAAELARVYATSEDTIRRDLRALAAEGRCRRVYGGALPAGEAPGPVSDRARRAPGAKAALGAALARLVEPGMTVFIDAGSTTLACAERLGGGLGRGVTVVTHAPTIAAALVEREGLRLVTLGGEVHPQVGAALGPAVLAALATIRPESPASRRLRRRRGGGDHRPLCRRRRGQAADRGAVGAGRGGGGPGEARHGGAVLGDALAACDRLVIEAGTDPATRARLAEAGPALIEVET